MTIILIGVVEAVYHTWLLCLRCLLSDRSVGLEGEGRRRRMSRLGVVDRAMMQEIANAQDRQVGCRSMAVRLAVVCMAYDSLAIESSKLVARTAVYLHETHDHTCCGTASSCSPCVTNLELC